MNYWCISLFAHGRIGQMPFHMWGAYDPSPLVVSWSDEMTADKLGA